MTQPDFTLLHAGNKEQGRGVCLCVCLPLNIVQQSASFLFVCPSSIAQPLVRSSHFCLVYFTAEMELICRLSLQSAFKTLCSHIIVKKSHSLSKNKSLSLSLTGSIYTAHTHTYVLIRASGSRRQSTRLRENALVLVGALSLPVGTSGSAQTLNDGSREKHLTLPLCAATAPCLPKNFKALVELRQASLTCFSSLSQYSSFCLSLCCQMFPAHLFNSLSSSVIFLTFSTSSHPLHCSRFIRPLCSSLVYPPPPKRFS